MAAELPVLLLADGTRVACRQRLRELPGRREVFSGERTGCGVVAKVYLDPRRAEVHARREASGLAAFAAAGIPAPELLYHGRDSAGRPVVVVREIAGAEKLASGWYAADAMQRASLMRDMMRLLAAHHTAGLCQNDLHLGNFLIADGIIFSIDGDAVERRHPPLGRRRSMRNLGLFGAQFLPEIDSLTLAESERYAAQRGWSVARLNDQLPSAIARARLRRWQKFCDKLYRDCSPIVRWSDGSGVCLVVRHFADDLAGELKNLDASCPSNPAQRLKNGNTATVWSLRAGGRDLVLKRYNTKSHWHGLTRMIRESRASVSWRNAHMLQWFGIPTPEPIAFCIRRESRLRPVAYFISERVHGTGLQDWVAQRQDNLDDIRRLARKLAALFAQLRRLQISHGDMKATNFLLDDEQLHVIDLDAMRLHHSRAVFERAWRRDIKRFYANWQNQPRVLEIMQREIDAIGDS